MGKGGSWFSHPSKVDQARSQKLDKGEDKKNRDVAVSEHGTSKKPFQTHENMQREKRGEAPKLK